MATLCSASSSLRWGEPSSGGLLGVLHEVCRGDVHVGLLGVGPVLLAFLGAVPVGDHGRHAAVGAETAHWEITLRGVEELGEGDRLRPRRSPRPPGRPGSAWSSLSWAWSSTLTTSWGSWMSGAGLGDPDGLGVNRAIKAATRPCLELCFHLGARHSGAPLEGF